MPELGRHIGSSLLRFGNATRRQTARCDVTDAEFAGQVTDRARIDVTDSKGVIHGRRLPDPPDIEFRDFLLTSCISFVFLFFSGAFWACDRGKSRP